jgi:hypothetical protein
MLGKVKNNRELTVALVVVVTPNCSHNSGADPVPLANPNLATNRQAPRRGEPSPVERMRARVTGTRLGSWIPMLGG